MKKLIIFQTVCHLMVSALAVLTMPDRVVHRKYSNLLEISTQSADNNPSDNVNAEKGCDVILNFSNMGFNHVRSNFINSLYVKNLTLRNNTITEFEIGSFDGLPNLEYLDVSRNQLRLTEFFSFGGHLNLKTLILDYNNIHYVSSDQNSNSYNHNQYYGYTTESPKVYRRRLEINPYYFPDLENLSLRKINIDSLSADWIFNFPKLKYLDLSENIFYEPAINVYNNIPSTVLHLSIESTGLNVFRSQQFKNMRTLNFNRNYFDNIGNRFCTGKVLCLQALYNLQSLFASSCSISMIDADAFKDTASLLKLDISNNKIVDVPKEIFLTIPSLVHLDLSMNNLSAIPDFGELKNLSSLKLDNMKNLTIFNSLSSFSFMPNLTTISMRSNNLNVIPQSFFERLPALREIDLSHNEITSLPPFMSQAVLRKLYLRFNRVVNIGNLLLTNATSLEILDLRNNDILFTKIGTLQMLPRDTLLFL